jgi:hypothetical protein
MNKRKTKKKVKYIMFNLQKVNLAKDDVLLFRFSTDKWKPESIQQFSEWIRENVTQKFVFIPKDFEAVKVSEGDTNA